MKLREIIEEGIIQTIDNTFISIKPFKTIAKELEHQIRDWAKGEKE